MCIRDSGYKSYCREHGFYKEGAPSVALVSGMTSPSVSYTHLRAHETPEHLVCRLLLEKIFLMIRRPPRSTRVRSSAASDVYKRQANNCDNRFCHSRSLPLCYDQSEQLTAIVRNNDNRNTKAPLKVGERDVVQENISFVPQHGRG